MNIDIPHKSSPALNLVWMGSDTIRESDWVHDRKLQTRVLDKTPAIVFDDADLDLALPMLEISLTKFAGQVWINEWGAPSEVTVEVEAKQSGLGRLSVA